MRDLLKESSHEIQNTATVVYRIVIHIRCDCGCAGGPGPGGGGGGGGGGKRPPTESTTNLSYPAYFYKTSLQTGTIGSYTLSGELNAGMSYGCLVKETIGTTTYDNTSCVTATSSGFAADTYEACLAKCTALGNPKVERIYWQKNASKWQAGYDSSGTTPLVVDYIDWGDNLESKTWPVQVIRVETNTFSSWPDTTLPGVGPRLRFDLWHVYGAGTNELWGVHATNPDATSGEVPAAYVYLDTNFAPNWSYAVNVTPTARLNITKLETGASSCPTASTTTPYTPTWIPGGTSGTGTWAGDEANPAYTVTDILYGAELNIKGSYVYGYNWNLRNQAMPSGVDKAGWWRLTFYTSDNSVDFTNFVSSAATLAPPTDTTVSPEPFSNPSLSLMSASDYPLRTRDRDRDRTYPGPTGVAAITPAADTGMLYVPQVDKDNQLTYIDICISGGKSGGGGRR
jgi:hypothetical protein